MENINTRDTDDATCYEHRGTNSEMILLLPLLSTTIFAVLFFCFCCSESVEHNDTDSLYDDHYAIQLYMYP